MSNEWKVAPGDPTHVFVGTAKPINCFSADRARLIAAAPDGLEAAYVARAELEAVEKEIGVPSRAVPMLTAFIEKATK